MQIISLLDSTINFIIPNKSIRNLLHLRKSTLNIIPHHNLNIISRYIFGLSFEKLNWPSSKTFMRLFYHCLNVFTDIKWIQYWMHKLSLKRLAKTSNSLMVQTSYNVWHAFRESCFVVQSDTFIKHHTHLFHQFCKNWSCLFVFVFKHLQCMQK